MTGELKAAAERLRKCELNSTSWDSGLEPKYRKDYTLFGHDTNTLAHAYLAEHPADDDEPVTEEWLVASGFLPDGDIGKRGLAKKIWDRFGETDWGDDPAMHLLFSDGGFWLESYGQSGDTLCLIELPAKNTRGDVRQLCRALGIELKETKESTP